MLSTSRLRVVRATLARTGKRLGRLATVLLAAAGPLALPAVTAHAQEAPGAGATPLPDGTGRYVLPFDVLQGAPELKPGQQLAYYLWHDDDGIHLRTTGPGPEHDFNGLIRAPGDRDDHFFAVQDFRLESTDPNHDRIHLGPRDKTIELHFDTFGGIDGVDFRLTGDRFCAELRNDGQPSADVVLLGKDEVRPAQVPVCFQR
jgi:hypothetical protein